MGIVRKIYEQTESPLLAKLREKDKRRDEKAIGDYQRKMKNQINPKVKTRKSA